MHGPRLRTVVLLGCGCVFSALPAVTQPAGPTHLYRLGDESAFLEGCIDGLCLCPVRFVNLEGTFLLTRLPLDKVGVRAFAVRNVSWRGGGPGDMEPAITGSGTYTLGDETHRLVLDLEVDDDPPIRVDSGEVPHEGGFPRIAIGGITDSECFQEGVDISARPLTSPIVVSLDPPDTVAWTDDSDTVSQAYDVVVGDLIELRAGGGDFTWATSACLADDVAVASASYAEPVGPGEAVWFLVRGQPGPGYDSGGAGQIGTRDPEIDASPFGCP